jgi:hypothetical protein
MPAGGRAHLNDGAALGLRRRRAARVAIVAGRHATRERPSLMTGGDEPDNPHYKNPIHADLTLNASEPDLTRQCEDNNALYHERRSRKVNPKGAAPRRRARARGGTISKTRGAFKQSHGLAWGSPDFHGKCKEWPKTA